MNGFLLSFVIGGKKMKIAGTFVTPLCNRPTGIYSLTGFSEKTSAGRQIFSPGCPFLSGHFFAFFKHTQMIHAGCVKVEKIGISRDLTVHLCINFF